MSAILRGVRRLFMVQVKTGDLVLVRVVRDFCNLLLLGILFHSSTNGATQADVKRPFTVQDSIEIARIVSPVASTNVELRGTDLPIGTPITSPDKIHFLLVTQRGLLSSNSIEATIWLFDERLVHDYVSGKSLSSPIPIALTTLRASTNTPVISEVRWLDTHRIAFLGKRASPYQQLFVADIDTKSLTALTEGNIYVTQYDMMGDTVAYTELTADNQKDAPEQDLLAVKGKNLVELLYPTWESIEDIEENELTRRPSILRIKRKGIALPLSFVFAGAPLRLFLPTVALSPNGQYLITVAPVHELPTGWENYRPQIDDPKYMGGMLRLTRDNKYALAEDNPWKASQYVLVDLESGAVSPLVNAPAGRGLLYVSPTKAFWFADSRRAILSNTFLPREPVRDEAEKHKREQGPAVAVVDVSDHHIEAISYLKESTVGAKDWYRVEEFLWDSNTSEITLNYERGPNPNDSPAPKYETYGLANGTWTKMSSSQSRESDPLQLSIDQDLNHPTKLMAHRGDGSSPLAIWDPNPQLERIDMAPVSLEHWQDRNGDSWSGLLVLPHDYQPGRRYPLVIQLYGYQGDKFFVDGPFTTGFAARALSGQGIVVLQLGWQIPHFRTPQDGPYQIEGFRSAIDYLSNKGLINPRQVGVVGFSFTGYHILYAITREPMLFAAASFTDSNTVSYWTYLLNCEPQGSTNSFQGLLEEINGAAPFGKGLSVWLHNAPGFNLDKVNTPLLISALERGELISEWEIYSGLRTLNKPVELMWRRAENVPHILVKPHDRYSSQQQTVDWFSFWLKGEEDPDPAKAEQYARWHELRKIHEVDVTPGHGPEP